MKLKSKFEKILSNKTLLNVVMIITFFNLIGYVMLQKTIAIVYFILIGLLTSFFSKNMTIVLGIPLILVNLFVANSNKWSLNMNAYSREGLKNNNTNETNNNNGNSTGSNQPIKNAIIAKKNSLANANTNNSSTTTSSSQGLPMTITPIQDNDNNTTFDNSMDNPTGESFEVGRSKKIQKVTILIMLQR